MPDKYAAALAALTMTEAKDWTVGDGPDSRCGLDYYYKHAKFADPAYINNDQGHVTITVDGETKFSGMEEDLPGVSATSAFDPEDPWESHPVHTVENWQHEVAEGNTRSGYISWVNQMIDALD